MERKARCLTLVAASVFLFSWHQLQAPSALGEEMIKTKIDPRDKFLGLQALCGCEGMPYEYMLTAEEYVKTKHDPNDMYIDLEAFCSEDMPYKYLVIPGKYVKTKIDYEGVLKVSPERLMSEDPTHLKRK